MAQNRFKPVIEEEKPAEVQSRRRSKSAAASPFFGSLNISAYLVFKNINFIFFLAFLGVIYIANSHYALKVIKEIKSIQNDLENSSWKSNSIKSELMYESMQSRVLEKVGHLGLKTLSGKPKKIEIEKTKKNKSK
jgi:cell division protein FtsL